jgi:hypothetical protein
VPVWQLGQANCKNDSPGLVADQGENCTIIALYITTAVAMFPFGSSIISIVQKIIARHWLHTFDRS